MINDDEYSALVKLKKEIDQILSKKNVNIPISFLNDNQIYNSLKNKDTQLVMLQNFLVIWLKEKIELENLEIRENIFENIDCLKTLEEKYWMITFVLLRFENDFPDEECLNGIKFLIQNNISAIAIEDLIFIETENRISNLLKITDEMKKLNQYVKIYMLLNLATKRYTESETVKNVFEGFCREI